MTDKAKLYTVKNDKGEFLSFYASHESVWDTNNPTFFNESYAEAQAGPYGHVVELVEAPAKVVVIEGEAEILEQAKCDDDPAGLIAGFVDYCDNYDDDHKAEDLLMRAYVNGWVVEKPKRWNVKVPHVNNGYYYKDSDGLAVFTATRGRMLQERSRFTDVEIEHYGLQDCEKLEVKTNG